MAYGQTATPQQRYRPVTTAALPNAQLPQQAFTDASQQTKAPQPPGPPQMDPAQVGAMPPAPAGTGGYRPGSQPQTYNDPANAPKYPGEDNSDLPPRPPKGQTFGWNKAQGGDGPASNTGYQDPTGHAPVVQPMTNQPQIGQPPVGTRPPSRLPAPPVPITPPTSPVGSGLRGEVFAPGGDPRLAGAQTATDNAAFRAQTYNRNAMQAGNEDRYRSVFGDGQIDAGQYGVNPNVRFRGVNPNVAGGPAVDPNESARTAKYGQAQDQALDGLQGPDRTALALQKLKDFDAVSEEQRFKEERSLGQNIAKFGRSGMQGNADNFGEIQRKIAGDRGRLVNDLAMNVSEGDINDRFRRVDATAGLRGQESGIDAGMRGERRTERDYGTGLDERNYGRQSNERDLETALDESNYGRASTERNTRLGVAEGNQDRLFARSKASVDAATGLTNSSVNDAFDQFNAAGSLEDRVFGQGQSNRGEMRTERNFQQQDAQQTIENRIKEREIQQAEEEMRLRRAALQAQAGGM
jgi:hypothetical protein